MTGLKNGAGQWTACQKKVSVAHPEILTPEYEEGSKETMQMYPLTERFELQGA